MPIQSGQGGEAGAAAWWGGRGNEAGSLYRSGVAAYLAAHGLAGRGVEAAGYRESGPAPVTLAFETGDAVDDIRCRLADGSTLWLQAKRACGVDAQLEGTVQQWVGQAGRLQEGDKIGLATAEPRGLVKHLGSALDRRRRPREVAGPFPTGEAKALEALRGKLPAGTPSQTADEVMNAAIVMAVAASPPRDEGFLSVAYLLDGTVVPAGSGTAAIAALQRAFQEQAATGAGSGLDDWLEILANAGLQVFPDASGPAGPRRRAELDAIAAHRARLVARDGLIEFSLLADDLPPMTYKPLADSLYLAMSSYSLGDACFLGTARRWTRMLLTGLPGMGKSTALEQAAARWAADDDGPVPVLVPLREIARRHPRRGADITLPALIEAATVAAPEQERASLRLALERAAASGEVMLLLDGLDECQDRRAVIADGLATMAGELPDGTGIVLATRDSGLAAAGKLNLPVARLEKPLHLDVVLTQVLDHIAACRVPESDRDPWVRQRRQRLEEIRVSHPDLWGIPLMAILLTLLIARPNLRELPTGRAQLLAEAVRGTVERWELARLAETSQLSTLRSEQLLDGYGEIAHVLIREPGGCPPDTVIRGVGVMLAERWGLAPGEALAQANVIMRFWDEHAGVFVASPATGDIQPRSRVFAETGEAMWATRQDTAGIREWIRAALSNNDHREQVILAAGLSVDVILELIQNTRQATDPAAWSRALLWAADATIDGGQPPDRSLADLIDALAQAAGGSAAPASQPSDDVTELNGGAPTQGWPYVRRIATLPVPSTLRPQRDRIMAGFELDDYERPLADALTALADAGTDGRDYLEPDEQEAVRQLLGQRHSSTWLTAAKARPQSAPGDRAEKHFRFLPGHLQVAERAARYAGELGQDAIAGIYRVGRHGYLNDYRRIHGLMIEFGHPDPEPPRLPADAIVFGKTLHLREDWQPFFTAAASLETPCGLTAAGRWRYQNLATLSDVLDIMQATLTDLALAFTAERMLLPGCMRAAVHASGLDLPAIAAEATFALRKWPAGNRDVLDVMFAPPLPPLPEFDSTRLDSQDKDFLIQALSATSGWLADIAATLLLTAHDQAAGQCAADSIPHMPVNRRKNAAIVAVANDPSPALAATRFLDAADPLVRAGAAAAALMLADSDASAWTHVLARAWSDNDLTVRLEAGAGKTAAKGAAFWTCRNCGQPNDVATDWCSDCKKDMRAQPVQGLRATRRPAPGYSALVPGRRRPG